MAVTRLMLEAGGKVALDQPFHSGINVLWGSNGAGKSTVLDLIYYALGGNDVSWKEVANTFERVSLELILGGDTVTLSRKFDSKSPSIEFYWGDMEKSQQAPINKWVSHSSRSSKHQESYSEVIFSLLGWPVVRSDEFNSITMTQVLRLIYGDQPSPPTKIFREAGFDSETTKSALGDFVLGAFNSELYRLKDLVRSLEADLSVSRAEIKAISNFLDKIEGEKTRLEIQNSIGEFREAIDEKYQYLNALEDAGEERSLTEDENARSEFENLSEDLTQLETEIETIELDIADSARFIKTLEEHLRALDEAGTLRDFLAEVEFDTCPSCLTPIEAGEPDCCHLCKSPLTEGSIAKHRMRARYELQMQVEESKRVRATRQQELQEKKREREALLSERKEAYTRYRSTRTQAASAGTSERERVFLEIGKLEERINVLHRRYEIVAKLEDLQGRVENLAGELAEASERHASEERATSRRRSAARKAINEECVWFLRNDLNYQAEFMSAEHVDVNFAKEIIAVDGVTRFSDSGHVYLKNSLLVAMLAASLRTPEMCMPSFLMLDGIEDKGMEVDRIHALQNNILAKASEFSSTTFQVIVTGTTISERVEEEGHIVGGKRFNRTDRLIDV